MFYSVIGFSILWWSFRKDMSWDGWLIFLLWPTILPLIPVLYYIRKYKKHQASRRWEWQAISKTGYCKQCGAIKMGHIYAHRNYEFVEYVDDE